MHIAFLIPLLTLFAGPSVPSRDDVLHSPPSRYAHHTQTATKTTDRPARHRAVAKTSSTSSASMFLRTSRTKLQERAAREVQTAQAVTSQYASTTKEPRTQPSAPVSSDPIAAPAASTSNAQVPASAPTSPAQPAPTATSESPSQSLAIESEIARLINVERSAAGLSPLAGDAKLQAMARAHSIDMRANDFFDHVNLAGCSSSCRATNANYAWQSIAENIYWMSGYHLSPEAAAKKVVDGWMQSPGHRANILGTSFKDIGVGIDISGTRVTATANFGAKR